MSQILAVVTTRKECIGGGSPIFIARSDDEREQLAFRLEKILDATAHALPNGLMILVRHDAT